MQSVNLETRLSLSEPFFSDATMLLRSLYVPNLVKHLYILSWLTVQRKACVNLKPCDMTMVVLK